MNPPTDSKQPAPPAASGPLLPRPHGDKPPLGKGTRVVLIILSVLLLVAALLSGFFLWKELQPRDDSAAKKPAATQPQDQPASDVPQLTCATGLSAYQNQDIGFGFCYPAAWGAITVADSKFETADTGQRWRVNFADKEQVHLNLKSTDWSTKQGRDGVCTDMTADMPSFADFATGWQTTKEGSETSYATRGVSSVADKYIITEEADSLLLSGVCLQGSTLIDDPVFGNTTATYSASFNAAISNPDKHMATPDVLIPVADRDAFAAFVASVVAL